jgi:exonuclease SbcC
MKILHTSDWHIGNYPGPEQNGINLRGKDIYDCLRFMTEKAKDEQPDLIVISGDIFHTAKVWADRGLNETYNAINIIKGLSEIAPVCVLRGTPNHDGDEQFKMMQEVFKEEPAITIFDTPRAEVISTKSGNINVAALPGFDRGVFRAKFPGLSKDDENQVFTEELGKIVLSLKAMCNPAYNSILIAHYTVPGCNTESGQTQFLAQFEPVLLPEALDAAGFDLVALGHIHRPQQVTSCLNTYYAGAINALNFNDEGQERGFWIHDFVYGTHDFIKTPHREFKTIRMANEDIAKFNLGNIDEVATKLWRGEIEGKIVRVIYNCTDELNKALNKAILEKELYSDGAFWVQEITPEKILITANRNDLSEKNSPEDNLREYLLEKAIPDDRIIEIIEAARPIIAEATANSITASLTGLFLPVEIEVKNYRNYPEETFSFEDITFCTINGKNGVGKSSLFMDAILDCLYEEPREGDLTGWISNNEKARSGSIKFTFKIGDRTFRVTRTRAKSGKATLNLSELIDGEWINRSKERMNDTQTEIINILGMDSLTLRSCALIMQDQYGLFLQADKESRMSILGNILGLRIYEDMENIAKDKVTELNRQIRQNNDQIEKLSSTLPNEEEVLRNIEAAEIYIEANNQKIKTLTDEADKLKLRLNSKLEAATRALKLSEGINTLNKKKADIEANKSAQIDVLNNSNIILSQEETIVAGVAKYNSLLAQEKELITDKALYDSKKAEYQKLVADIEATKAEIARLNIEKASLVSKKKPYEDKVSVESQLKAKHEQYTSEKAALSILEEKAGEYIRFGNEISAAERQKAVLQSQYDTEYTRRITEYRSLKEKAALLDNSGCIDPANARCRFLVDAKEAKSKMFSYKNDCQKWQAEQKAKLEEAQKKIDALIEKRNALGYEQDAINSKRALVSSLEKAAKEYEALLGYKEQIKLINERIQAIDSKVNELQDKVIGCTKEKEVAEQQLTQMKVAADQYNSLILEIEAAKSWLDKEKLLPVAKEKKAIAEIRIAELDKELTDIAAEIMTKQQELEVENQTASGSDELKSQLSVLETSISDLQTEIQKLSMNIGAYNKQLEYLQETKAEISKLQQFLKDVADKVTIYEELKKAFSQDGVPHNIIRSIVPMLEATANNILGQMSGGKMSVEFVTEKMLKSNNKKEVVTLDIFINDNGRLPYLSKSGGERVKSSLAVILALAEIKSSRAGIQLGMLFIDEPPFLDSEGIQAYCDALETIQNRYRGLKVMAITHDPTMKARFPQAIEIEKTEEGSRVIYG